MSARNWEKERVRSKQELMRAAAGDLPRTISARFRGQCHVCHQWWKPGARLARTTADRWAHAACAADHNLGTDVAARLAARRARLKATKESTAH